MHTARGVGSKPQHDPNTAQRAPPGPGPALPPLSPPAPPAPPTHTARPSRPRDQWAHTKGGRGREKAEGQGGGTDGTTLWAARQGRSTFRTGAQGGAGSPEGSSRTSWPMSALGTGGTSSALSVPRPAGCTGAGPSHGPTSERGELGQRGGKALSRLQAAVPS